jgi:hypothetical protein
MEATEGPGCSVGILCGLTALTRLTINLDGEECNEGFWRCMAAMTTLKDLYIRELDMAYFGGVVSLVDCRKLSRLRTDHSEHFPGFDLEVRSVAWQLLLAPAHRCSSWTACAWAAGQQRGWGCRVGLLPAMHGQCGQVPQPDGCIQTQVGTNCKARRPCRQTMLLNR